MDRAGCSLARAPEGPLGDDLMQNLLKRLRGQAAHGLSVQCRNTLVLDMGPSSLPKPFVDALIVAGDTS
jgi:hypothetical protein